MMYHLYLLLLWFELLCVSADNVISQRGVTDTNPDRELFSNKTKETSYIYQQCTTELSVTRHELKDVRSENREMKEAIAELQMAMTYLQQRDADYRKQLEQNSREITMLTTQYKRMSLSEVSQTGSSNRADPPNLQERSKLINNPARQKLSGSAFYARLGQKFAVQDHEQTIIYDVVMTNGGSAYDNKTGVFTCTTSGVYVFSWSALVTADHYVETILRSNKADLGLTYSGSKGYPGSGSQTVVVDLHQGDHVQVKIGSFIPGSILYDIYTSFSGFQLQ
ncbi:uncharacterized protein LOC117316813 [Pecten maximus]|uniref:uncharacterized protein LOC117316813 n=1 Tax=Pecten maximus TaxID=6579 RepID=UPI001458C352|nr:uncharacterized protein LOC117316813 [Pecten maximus]